MKKCTKFSFCQRNLGRFSSSSSSSLSLSLSLSRGLWIGLSRTVERELAAMDIGFTRFLDKLVCRLIKQA